MKLPGKKYEILLNPKNRHKCLYGGRGGAKSWSAAEVAIYIADKCKCTILCTREVQISIQDSMYKLVKNLIISNGLENNFRVLEKGIYGLRHGSEFIFKGMQDIKSLESIDIAIVEEAQQVSKENAERLIPTIRNPRSQIWWLWNPENEDDWVQQYFIEKPPPNTLIQKVNFTDNIFCPQVLIDEASHLKETNFEEYRHIWLGELKPKNTGWRTFNPDWLDFAAGFQQDKPKPLDSPRLMSRHGIGSDLAFSGVDKWVTLEGKGNKALSMTVVDYSDDDDEMAANLHGRVIAAGRFNCDLGVDCNAIGRGVGSILKKKYGLGDILNELNKKDKDWTPPVPSGSECLTIENFDCWRSQAWYLLLCDLKSCNLDLSELAEKQPEEYKELVKEILMHEIFSDKNGKMRVTPKDMLRKKEYLGRSPDRADALVAWNWVRKRVDDFATAKPYNPEKDEYSHYFA